LSQYHLSTDTRLFRITRSDLNISVSTNVPCHEDLVVGLELLADRSYPLQGEVPVLFRETHRIAIVLKPDVKQRLAMALCQALLYMLDERRDILFSGIGKQRLQANVRLVVVGKTELV
jgi:hypothetical protein